MGRTRRERKSSARGKRGNEVARKRLEDALRGSGAELTPSERAIAAYFHDNLSLIPFETGASIAAETGVSEMTVIRFVRSLGYANLKELKESLRATLAVDNQGLDDVLDRFRVRHDGLESLRESLELEIRAVVKAYELTVTERWQKIVHLIAKRRFVHVVAYQATKGVGLDFANRLKYAHSGVRFVEGSAGTYSEILEMNPRECCVVLIDTVLYAKRGLLLARKARDLGIPVVIVTDRFSHWAHDFTDLVLEGNTHVKLFWDSTSSLTVILNLLINSVAAYLGKKAEERYRFMIDLGEYFQEFEPMSRILHRRGKVTSGR